MNIILLEPDEVRDGGSVSLSGARAEHLLSVLGVTPGREVNIGVLDGALGVGTVTALGAGSVEFTCRFEADAPPRPAVDLLLALPRPKVLRRLWAQLAALGVGQIILTNASRVERNYFDTHVLAPECHRPLLVEGLQQARDTRVPNVSVHRRFKVLVEDDLDGLFQRGLRLVAHPGPDRPLASVITGPTTERVLLAIGPEGGWDRFELDLLAAHGFQSMSMGGRTLRTDTACIALLALVHAALRQE